MNNKLLSFKLVFDRLYHPNDNSSIYVLRCLFWMLYSVKMVSLCKTLHIIKGTKVERKIKNCCLTAPEMKTITGWSVCQAQT